MRVANGALTHISGASIITIEKVRCGHLMPSRRTSSCQSFDEKILTRLDGSWRTVGEIGRLLGVGKALDVAIALDRLWKAERIEKDDARVIVGAGRKGGGGKLRFLRFRRTRKANAALDYTADRFGVSS